jgi:NADH-quinone oxidoreductase subunit M
LAFYFGMAMMASIGLPGLGNFVGEVMVFFSAFKSYNPATGLAPLQWACILAIWGVVISAVYGLRSFRRIFHGEPVPATAKAVDLTWMEKLPAALLLFVLLLIGIFPGVLLQFLN